jgi:hypothetical protein
MAIKSGLSEKTTKKAVPLAYVWRRTRDAETGAVAHSASDRICFM